jgi:hypothetical protein
LIAQDDDRQGPVVDVYNWVSRVALDIMGIAGQSHFVPLLVNSLILQLVGFDYQFDAINGSGPNELYLAFSELFASSTNPKAMFLGMLKSRMPILNILVRLLSLGVERFLHVAKIQPDYSKSGIASKQALSTMERIGRQIFDEKKSNLLATATRRMPRLTPLATKGVDGRDLLSVLCKHNYAAHVERGNPTFPPSEGEHLSAASQSVVGRGSSLT